MGLSTHVLDTARGRPAQGVDLTLELADEFGKWQLVGRGQTDGDGRCGAAISRRAEQDGTRPPANAPASRAGRRAG